MIRICLQSLSWWLLPALLLQQTLLYPDHYEGHKQTKYTTLRPQIDVRLRSENLGSSCKRVDTISSSYRTSLPPTNNTAAVLAKQLRAGNVINGISNVVH